MTQKITRNNAGAFSWCCTAGHVREANIAASKWLTLKGLRGEHLTAHTLRGSPKCPTSPRYFRVILTRAVQGSAILSETERWRYTWGARYNSLRSQESLPESERSQLKCT